MNHLGVCWGQTSLAAFRLSMPGLTSHQGMRATPTVGSAKTRWGLSLPCHDRHRVSDGFLVLKTLARFNVAVVELPLCYSLISTFYIL